MAEKKGLIFQESYDNDLHFDKYIYPNNSMRINNKSQIKELNYKYINTTEEIDSQENLKNINDSSNFINLRIKSDAINKTNNDAYYLNKNIPYKIEHNDILNKSVNNNNKAINSHISINYDPNPAYNSKTNHSYNDTNNSIERDNLNGSLNLNKNISNNINNNLHANSNSNFVKNNIPNSFENSSNSVNLNSNFDKLFENLKNHSQELSGKNCENMKLKEENFILYNSINSLEATCVGFREENEYKIFLYFKLLRVKITFY